MIKRWRSTNLVISKVNAVFALLILHSEYQNNSNPFCRVITQNTFDKFSWFLVWLVKLIYANDIFYAKFSRKMKEYCFDKNVNKNERRGNDWN